MGTLEGLDGEDGLGAEGPTAEQRPAVVAGAAGDRRGGGIGHLGEGAGKTMSADSEGCGWV